MDLRETIVLSAAGGVAVACAASLAFAGRSEAAAIQRLDQRVGAVAIRTSRPGATPQIRVLANAPPLFPVLSGARAAPEVAVRREGVARTPQRTAALVAINGAPAAWLALGETRDGVTVEDVAESSVTLGTARGPRTIALGQGGPAPAAEGSPQPAEPAPPGVRSPPEPASAPPAKS